MDLLLFEPDLRDFGGHYNRDIRVLGAVARRNGVKLTVAANKHIEPRLCAVLEALGVVVLPVFENVQWRLPAGTTEEPSSAFEIAEMAFSCFRNRRGMRPVWPSGRGVILAAACLFAMKAREPFVIRMLDFSFDWPAGYLTAPDWLRSNVEQACEAGMRIYAETEFIARQLSSEIGAPVGALSAVLECGPLADRCVDTQPVVGFMNILRGSKNPESSLSALIGRADAMSLVLHMGQGTKTGLRSELRVLAEEILGLGRQSGESIGRTPRLFRRHVRQLARQKGFANAKIKIVPGVLSAEAYDQLWRSLHCCIMPYDVVRYARKGSGMLSECFSDGIIPIAPEGTALADSMKNAGVGVTYNSKDNDGLSRALEFMLSRFNDFHARSQAYALVYRAENTQERILDSYRNP